jgi:uncharacterized membrane protein
MEKYMAELSNAKILGGIGAILMLIGLFFISSIGFGVFLVGLILVFIAVKNISDITNDKEIFSNYLMNFIFSIISWGAVIAIMIIAFGAIGGFSWIAEIQTAEINDIESFMAYFGSLIGACAIALVVWWIMSIIAAIYLKRSYNSIANHTKVDLFKTTGTVNLIAAITYIILIGFLISFIAKIIEIIAYFSLPDKLPMGEKKGKNKSSCPNCGREIPIDARVCPYCGKKLEE